MRDFWNQDIFESGEWREGWWQGQQLMGEVVVGLVGEDEGLREVNGLRGSLRMAMKRFGKKAGMKRERNRRVKVREVE